VSDSIDLVQGQRPVENRSDPIRRMTLADGLILIAAVGIGLGMARVAESGYSGPTSPAGDHPFDALVYSSLCWSGLALMIAVAPLRLVPPRPPMRRIRRQPGFVASVASVFYLAQAVMYIAVVRLVRPQPWGGIGYLYYIGSPTIGSTILFAWFILAVSGRWRAERSWIDRFGRAMGIGWIIAYIAHICAGGLW
jgi:hypothetical protein